MSYGVEDGACRGTPDPVGSREGSEILCFHQIFEQQAERHREAPALRYRGSAGPCTLTYGDLDARCNRLARGLRTAGVGPETVVALAAERGPELMVGMLAVLKAGGAFLPLDPGHPDERLTYQLRDSGAGFALVTGDVAQRLTAAAVQLLDLGELEQQARSQPEDAVVSGVLPAHLAYLIYTSGSTGRPKGVMVPHLGLGTLCAAQRRRFGAGPGKRVLQWAPPSFDASVFEILMALGAGACLVLADRQTLMPGPQLLRLLETEEITHWTVPPSVLAAVDSGDTSARLGKLENLVCAGEALPAALAAAWAGGRRLWNAYGPTEATVWSSVARCTTGRRPTLGNALEGVSLAVATPALTPVAEGEVGELLIGGLTLARGYLGRPALTAERFVPDALAEEPGRRRYRSGDAVRRLENGELDFVGRVDHQIKIRGQRIEPGEVEAVLDRHPSVRRTYAMARQDGGGEPRLVAYLVLHLDHPVAGHEVESAAAWADEHLPGAMVPSAFVVLEELPLTHNGKVDRDALPAPSAADFAGRSQPGLEGGEEDRATAPRNPVESALVEICSELWGLPELGIHDDLLALGGHSLLIGQLAARVRAGFGVDVSLQEIFTQPTVAGLATVVRGGGAGLQLPPIEPAPEGKPAPLSFPMERVWFLDQLAPGNVAYNSQASFTYHGPLQPRVYQQVLTEVVRRHEVFRSRFPAVDGSPVQIVEEPMVVPLPLLDLRRLPEAVRHEESERLVRRALQEPFDLLSPPLARWVLLRHGREHHVLIQVEHHFVHDGWAFAQLLKETKALYPAFAAGEPSPLEPPPVQMRDFALWQRQWMRGEVLEEYLDFFTRMLEGSPPALELPTDLPRPPMQSFRGDAVRVDVPEDLAEALRAMVRSRSTTLFISMLAAFKVLLWRYSGQLDLLIGTAAANRRLKEVELMLGMVVNTLVLRTRLTPQMPYTALLQSLRNNALGAFAYQDMPLDKLVERLDPDRDLSRNPLFQAMFSFHDSPVPEPEFGGLRGELLERHNGSAKSDLNVVAIPRAEQRISRRADGGHHGAITLIWEYCTDLFQRSTMERMVEHYFQLLRSAVANPDAPLETLSLLADEERQQILVLGQGGRRELSQRSLNQLFEARAEERPEALAVSDGERSWSYGELEERSNRLARWLRRHGVGHGVLVGLCLPRGVHLPLGALASLKAGGAYLPLDPQHPSERIAYALEDSGVRVLLTAGGAVPAVEGDVLCLDLETDWHRVAEESAQRPAVSTEPLMRAYVIYTSGSTGRPKGTEVTHRGAINLVTWHLEAFQLGTGDHCALVASPAFDASVWELWPPLAAGASLHVPPSAARTDPETLYRWLAQAQITVTFLPTPLAEAMLEEEAPPGLALRILLVGGDRLRRAPRPGLPFRLINNYGPTEDAVVTTSGEVAALARAQEARPPSIGRVLPNKRLLILDRRLSPVPLGVPGELFIGGAGLARGYLHRPGLTADRFLPDPFPSEGSEPGDGSRPGGRLYRTGDRVRWLPGGEIEFLGRTDHQVKVRGYRIELGEIEAQLEEHPQVHAAVVVALPGAAGLAAFIEPVETEDGEVDLALDLPDRLAQHLAPRLPDYMMPAGFAVVDQLPLTPTGKVDRGRLAQRAPKLQWGRTAEQEAEPQGETEELLATLWARLLGIPRVGRHDTFFALGGHSLLATRLMARVTEAFGVDLPVRVLFEAPTVAQLAERVEDAHTVASALPEIPLRPLPRDGGMPMSFAQERLWFLDKLIAHPAAYHIARAWSVQGPLAVASLQAAIQALVNRHEALRTRFVETGGRVLQQVEDELTVTLPVVDLSGLPPGPRRAVADRLREREGRRPFALHQLPLMRWTLLRLEREEHHLQLTQHHITTDGLSVAIVLHELAELYAAMQDPQVAEPAARLRPLPLQYADFTVWQRRRLDEAALEQLVTYWRQVLAGAPAVLELPLDHPRPSLQSHRGDLVAVALDPQVAQAVHQLAHDTGTTCFMTMLSIYSSFLARVSGQREVVVGTPVAGRDRSELEGLVGLFVNTLALRVSLAGDPTPRQLLDRVRGVVLGALAHQALPVERLVEEVAPDRDLSHAPVFQTLLVPADPAMDTLRLGSLATAGVPVRRGESQFDLALFVREDEVGVELALRYDTELFDPTTALRMAGQLRTLLTGFTAEPDLPVGRLPLLAPAERQAVILEWNDTAGAFPAGHTMHRLFEEQVQRQPSAPALVTAGETLGYGELDARANRLAHQLRRLGAGPGTLVGVHLPRRPAMVVAVLAVLKSGAAYVPLESSWPAERCRWIIDHKEIGVLITESHRVAPLDDPEPLQALGHVICLDDPGEGSAAEGVAGPQERRLVTAADVAGCSAAAPAPWAGPEDLAYIIFTSGSTGRPKGVMVRHRPAVNLIHWVNRTFAVGPGDRVLFTTALAFDLSVYDIFGILGAGGTVRLASEEELESPLRLVEILQREAITFWDSAPAALVRLVPLLPERPAKAPLRLVFLSGDWIPVSLPDRLRRAFPEVQVIGLGGATEATIWSNFYPVGAVDPTWASIPYGRPIQNARYHVVDQSFEPCPVGVAGDLLIGGEVLSTGYAQEPALTARQYLPDAFAGPEDAGGRLYRTGDRARFWADGVLEFLGRRDTQVKVRGYRIELGEIESVLAEAAGDGAGLREVVVLVREDVPGDQRLVAYYTTTGASPADLSEPLRAAARAQLPEYMVPSAFVALEQWPLTATGKLDRKALPSPEQARQVEGAPAASPRTRMETVVAEVWRDVIGVAEVGREDNFFDLGGHSLLIARVHGRLAEALDRDVPMADLFRYPTVATLAAALAGVEEPLEAAEVSPAPAQDAQESTAIAIVGMAGRFAAAGDVEELWRALREGRELIRDFSEEELRAAGVPEEVLSDPRYVRRRGAVDDPYRFDAGFFEIPPREAEIVDPQQRAFLETSWQALEDAGYIAPARGERIGVFAGVSANGYLPRLMADSDLVRSVGEYALHLGNQGDYLPTRVSYRLDLHGPSLNVQTACSTSLVAVHLASQSLLRGDCELALAGGVCIRADEQRGYFFEEGGIASPDGHCRAFDAGAAGTVGGSGVGVVVLKRLDRAVADGDTVRAVILGSALNNDGARKVGFTAPSVGAQALAIRQAHAAAGVEAKSISYVEAHGTGTPMGDPIEVAALREAFGSDPNHLNGCALGSVKSNLGHLDAAAGVAGLIKTVLALEREEIPPTLHMEEPNSELEIHRSSFRLATELLPWRRDGRPRRAGVSSFGIGGTNAHLVVEEAPPPPAGSEGRPVQLLVLSAKTPEALERMSQRLAAHLDHRLPLSSRELADVAYTLQVGRRAMAYRRTVVCRDAGEAVAALRGEAPEQVWTRERRPQAPPVVLLLSGQGAQYAGMAARLFHHEAVFRAELERAAEVLEPILDVGLEELLFGARGDAHSHAETEAEADRRLADTRYTQPVLFAVEHALAKLWQSLGVEPAALLGHSVGEYVAATLAGVFRFEDALRLVALRGSLMAEMPAGAMLSAELSEAELQPLLEEHGLELAAVNGPRACVASGDEAAVAALEERLQEGGVSCRRLTTSHAFHSRSMEAAAEDFVFEVMAVERQEPRLPVLSNVTGRWLTAEQALDPEYWADQLRRTVRFGDGLNLLLEEPGGAESDSPATLANPGLLEAPLLLEVGPGRQLATLARRHPRASSAVLIQTSLPHPRQRKEDLEAWTTAIGRLWAVGVEVSWTGYYAEERRRRVPLPTYPFAGGEYRAGASARVGANGASPGPAAMPAPAEPPAGAPEEPTSQTYGSATEAAIAGIWQEMLGVDTVGPGDDFFELGGSSLMAIRLGARLEEELNASLPASAVLESSSLRGLARRVEAAAGSAEVAPASCLVLLGADAGEGESPLFLVHQVGGQAFTFRSLGRSLTRALTAVPGGSPPLYAFRSLGLESGEEPLTSIEAMAEHYLSLLRERQPAGPYRLGGASMGGMVAYELAQRLLADGEDVELLALFDTPCLDQMPPREDEAAALAAVFAGQTGSAPEVEELRALEGFEARFEAAWNAARDQLGEDARLDREALLRSARVLLANAAALYGYEPQPLDGSAVLLRAQERRPGDPPRPELAWIQLVRGGLDFVVTPGHHLTMHEPPHVATVAQQLARRLVPLPGQG
ncbi:MAG: amino acid adenylation domain-containing protein [Acidobacteriota bacterium]|nr:amino acid adenylation domain-containing protein [Acidobacteriota bacterium]